MSKVCISVLCIGCLILISHEALAERPLIDHFVVGGEFLSSYEYQIVRLDVDVTGDGNPELLLALTDRVPRWFIYEKVGVSRYRYLGHLAFLSDYFRVETDPPPCHSGNASVTTGCLEDGSQKF